MGNCYKVLCDHRPVAIFPTEVAAEAYIADIKSRYFASLFSVYRVELAFIEGVGF